MSRQINKCFTDSFIYYDGGGTTVLSFLNLPIICKMIITPIYIKLITIVYRGSKINPFTTDAGLNPIPYTGRVKLAILLNKYLKINLIKYHLNINN